MACRPARKLMVKNGVPCQTTTTITENMARWGSESQEMVSSIRFSRTRMLLMSPLASSKIQRQFRADMTVGMAQGMRRNERNRLLQKRSWLSTSAMLRPEDELDPHADRGIDDGVEDRAQELLATQQLPVVVQPDEPSRGAGGLRLEGHHDGAGKGVRDQAHDDEQGREEEEIARGSGRASGRAGPCRPPAPILAETMEGEDLQWSRRGHSPCPPSGSSGSRTGD